MIDDRALAQRAITLLTNLHLKPRGGITSRSSNSRRADHRDTGKWGWSGHIRGFGVGLKPAQEGRPAKPCITFYVRRIFPKERLPKAEQIPEELRLKSMPGRSITTDVVEINGPIVAHAAASIQPGDDISHNLGIPGTMAVLVRCEGRPGIFAVSCSHVLARSGVGVKEGDFVEHPPLLNGGTEDEFGHLTNDFTRLNDSDIFEEDFAMALIDVPHVVQHKFLHTILTFDPIAGAGPFQPGTETVLSGTMTPNASGTVLNPEWTGVIHDMFQVGDVRFQKLVSYRTDCDFGDSGGVVTASDRKTLYGLHVGGSSADRFGLFMPLAPIFERLKLSTITQ